jgi:hypothetical protein
MCAILLVVTAFMSTQFDRCFICNILFSLTCKAFGLINFSLIVWNLGSKNSMGSRWEIEGNLILEFWDLKCKDLHEVKVFVKSL